MPSILDLYTKTVENVQDFVTDTMWRALGWPSEDAWREAGSPDMTYNAYQTQGVSAGAAAAPVGPQPLEAVAPNVVEPLAPAAAVQPPQTPFTAGLDPNLYQQAQAAITAPPAPVAGAVAAVTPEAQGQQQAQQLAQQELAGLGGVFQGVSDAGTGLMTGAGNAALDVAGTGLQLVGDVVGPVAGMVPNIPVTAPLGVAAPGINAGLSQTLTQQNLLPTLGEGTEFAMDEQGNPVSRFMANEVRPVVGDISANVANAFARATPEGAGANLALGAVGTDLGEVARFAGETLTPASPADIALSVFIPATADWMDAKRILQSSGVLDDAGRLISGVSKGRVDDLLRQAGKSYDELVNTISRNIGPPGGGMYSGVPLPDDSLRRQIDEAAGLADEASRVTAEGVTTPGSAAGDGVTRTPAAPADLSERLSEATVDTVARNIMNTTNPDEVVNQIRQLDPMQRMELSLLVGEGNPKAMRDFGSLLTRAEQGDRQAIDQLARTFFRDNAVLRNRAAQMENLMKSLSSPSGGMYAGIPVDFNALPKPGSLKDEATALVGLPRTLKASFDLSAPGRQGLALAFRHPKEWLESWKPMLQAWKSEDGMRLVNEKIDNIMSSWRSKYGDVIHSYQTGAVAEGLERVPGFEAAGEGIVSGVTRQIPGLEKSERAYATFLNYQKAKTFDTMARALERAGVTDANSFKHLGSIIDHATGYGAAPLKGRFEGQAFFSQRYLTSRLQFLVDPITEGLVKGDLRAAQAAAENLVAFMGGMAGLAFLANESGVIDVNLDPRSSDFGKFRIGPQRFDFGAGFLPVLRTAARVATGQAKSGTGGIYEIDEKNELLKFFRNKLAPIPSEVVTRLVGEDPVGDKPVSLTSPDIARQMFMPLIADAVLEAFEETGSPVHAGLAAVSELVGGGTSTYGVGQSFQRAIADERFGKEFDNLDARQQAEVNAEVIESGNTLEWRERVAPWWTARDDAFSYWKATVDEESKAHPVVAHVLEQDEIAGIFPTPDSDGELAKWIQQTYGVSRQEAVDYANGIMKQTGLEDLIKRFRGQVPTVDTTFVQDWLDAYNAGDADDAPPKWLREFSQELVGAR